MASDTWVPTAKLRFVERGGDMVQGVTIPAGATSSWVPRRILQQWYAEDVPGYMRSTAAGEWRDVVVEVETAP